MSATLPSAMPRLLVFDWDGTVVDSIRNITECAQHALRDLDWAPPSTDTIRDAIGLGLSEIAARFRPDAGPEELDQLVRAYRHHWVATYGNRSAVIPGVAEALAVLEARGFLLAVATGKGRVGLESDLDRTGLRGHFVATRTASEAPSKPSPTMLLDVLRELGTGPDEALMIGDTSYDLTMAANARVASVGVLTGSHQEDALAACAPRAVLASAAAVPAWLEFFATEPSGAQRPCAPSAESTVGGRRAGA